MARPLKNGVEVSLVQHLSSQVRQFVPPIARDGRPFVLGAAAATVLVWRVRPLRLAGLAITGALAAFFREPARVTPQAPGAVIATSDGKICAVDMAVPPAEANMGKSPMRRISTFLSLTDVHVQRAPINGRVVSVTHTAGAFLAASHPDASQRNERTVMVIEVPGGRRIVAVQVAGLIARRIVTDARPGDVLRVGATYGLMRFGSRVDLYLPTEVKVAVLEGQRAVGGETVVALL